KRAVALDDARAEVAKSCAEPQLVRRTCLAQAVVHHARGRGIGEANSGDADSHANARQHRIVERRRAAEVGIIDTVSTAVVEIEAANLRFGIETRLLGAHAFAESVGG